MNQVKLSGRLASDVGLHTLGHGVQTAIATLSFSKNSDGVLLIAIDARIRQLAEFRKGDAIAITGRLIVHPKTKRPVVLIDVAGHWKVAVNHRRDFEDDSKADKATREVIEVL